MEQQRRALWASAETADLAAAWLRIQLFFPPLFHHLHPYKGQRRGDEKGLYNYSDVLHPPPYGPASEFEQLNCRLLSIVVETESTRFQKERLISENPEFPFPLTCLLSFTTIDAIDLSALMTQNTENRTALAISSPPYFWPELYCLQTSVQGSKDRLVWSQSPMRHFIIEMMTAPSSPLSCCIYAPIYAALGSVLLFLLERKRTRQSSSLKKYMYILQSKIPRLSLSVSNSQEGWGCQGREAAERLSKNKEKHMAVNPEWTRGNARRRDQALSRSK